MGQFIELKDSAARKKIAKHFNISLANLSQILHFKREGVNAENIREMAKQNGGVLMTPDTTDKQIHILNAKGETERIITTK